MELYKEILIRALENEDIKVSFPNLKMNAEQILNAKCYLALEQIKAIVQDEQLDDKECFRQIENVVLLFEKMGIDAGSRHDY